MIWATISSQSCFCWLCRASPYLAAKNKINLISVLTIWWWCKKQYCKGTWNVKSINQGKLPVVKQEMPRVNIDILGISELKWTGVGEFNSDDPCTTLFIVRKIPQDPHTAPQLACHPLNNERASGVPFLRQDEAWVSNPNSAGTLWSESEMERKPEVPASTRDEALFH